MKLFHADPPALPPGRHPACGCFNQEGSRHGRRRPRIHGEVQDTNCDAWRHVVDRVENAVARGEEIFDPLAGLPGPAREQIMTLPASLGRLVRVRELKLYGSHLVSLPPEIGAMTSLADLDVYTSYRLHFLPYELTRCTALRRSRASTRALYGNYKFRSPFPDLMHPANAVALARLTPATCSVCDTPLLAPPVRRWITLAAGADWFPLLVNACSTQCVHRLPTPPPGYVQEAHAGGLGVVQPPPRYE